MLGTDLLLKDIHVYVVNSQQLLQQMQQLKELFLGNNTTNATPLDLAEVITANSPAAIKAKLKESFEKQQANQQQEFQQKQDEIKANQDVALEKENRQDERNTENNQTKIEVAEIAADAKAPIPTLLRLRNLDRETNWITLVQFEGRSRKPTEQIFKEKE